MILLKAFILNDHFLQCLASLRYYNTNTIHIQIKFFLTNPCLGIYLVCFYLFIKSQLKYNFYAMLMPNENSTTNFIENLFLCSKFYICILNWVVFSRKHWSYYHIILVCTYHQHLGKFNSVQNEANLKVLPLSATILYFSCSTENFLFAGGLCWSCQESQQLEGKIYINHIQ